MLRVLFSVLSVVVAVLAIVFGQPLLFAVAALLLLAALILFVGVLRRRHREAQPLYMTPPPPPTDDLKALGIVDIRPVERSKQDDEAGNGVAAHPEVREPSAMAEAAAHSSARPDAETALAPARPVATLPEEADAPSWEASAPAPLDVEKILLPYLQALRAALDARTVCLLKRADAAPVYQIVALVTETSAARPDRAFTTSTPLLTARMMKHAVTVQSVGEGGLSSRSLGYSPAPAAVREVALAPVPHPADAATYILLVDTVEGPSLDQPRLRTVLAQFARLLGVLLDAPDAPPRPPRPRREIIAEEMAQARDGKQVLALALVHLNRAEAVAEEGAAAVAAAEGRLEARLRQATRHGRIERFGELTYGVFYDGDAPDVEAWGSRLQATLAGETGLLEGGASIGIALLNDRHEGPDDFRADATAALRTAYESGACTILK